MPDDVKSPSVDGAKTDTIKSLDETGGIDARPSITPNLTDNKVHVSKGHRFSFHNLSKRQWLILGGVLCLFIAGVSAFFILHKKPKPMAAVTTPPKATPAPAPTTVAARLSGVQVPPDQDKRPVRGFMIENSPDARPQSGLTDAEVVYEAVAEGGITRFLALFQINRPQYIGPVRSARPYYLDFLLPFDAALAHAGGSPDALNAIAALHVKNLDEFANAGAYMRVSTRFAPHNLYTTMDKIDALMNQKGFTSSTFTAFPRKAEAKAATPTAKSIDFNMSSFLYNPHYDYDAATNTYKRSEGGKPHFDEKSGAQIAPKVVVALVMGQSLMSDGLHTVYTDTGSGHMYVFQDGTVTEGTWSKSGSNSQFVFTGTDGKPLAFDPGQTWISLVNATSKVSYK